MRHVNAIVLFGSVAMLEGIGQVAAAAEPIAAASASSPVSVAPMPTSSGDLLDKIMKSRCRTSFCVGRDGQWEQFGFELFAEVPIGNAWMVGGSDKTKLSGIDTNAQIRSQFQRDAVSLQGGARFFFLKGLVSLGFVFAAYKAEEFTLERDSKETFTIGKNSVKLSPALYLGIMEDVISATVMWTAYSNDGAGRTFSDGEIIRRGETVATADILTLGIAPVSAFRAAFGLGKDDSSAASNSGSSGGNK
jgi:hypothetical protein